MTVTKRLATAFADGTAGMEFAIPTSRGGLRRDMLSYRLLRITQLRARERETLRIRELADGAKIVFRVNRGDLWTVREVFLEQSYRLPVNVQPQVIIDLGANIGLTSLWFATVFNPSVIIAVEPMPENVALARLNLHGNGYMVDLLEAAVVAHPGAVGFERNARHSLGKVKRGGDLQVAGVTMNDLLDRTPDGQADLVKMDIEGGEEELLLGDVAWARRVGMVVAEMHPTLVDYDKMIGALKATGMRYIPAGSFWRGQMDCFIRDDWPFTRGT